MLVRYRRMSPRGKYPSFSASAGEIMDADQVSRFKDVLYSLVPDDGTAIGNKALRSRLEQDLRKLHGHRLTKDEFWTVRNALKNEGRITLGLGRGGSVRRNAFNISTDSAPEATAREQTSAAGSLSISDSQSGNNMEADPDGDSVVEGDEDDEPPTVDPAEMVVIEKADRSLSELHRWNREGRLILDPEWQRNYVWDDKRASRLIESFLMGIPVPVVYLAKTADQKYEVIDGVQRLTSVFRFFDNQLALRGIDALSDYRGLTFSALPQVQQNTLTDATLRTLELSSKTSKELLFVIFERLNTGGMPLSDMEIRNCIYRGHLNELIKELSKSEEFVKAINQKGIDARMMDRLLVLRFLAFYEQKLLKAQGGLKKFFNDFCEQHRNPPDRKLQEFAQVFKTAMRAAYTIFGDRAFRLRRFDRNGSGEWRGRINASVFQVLAVSFTEYDLGQLTRRADAIREEYLDLITGDTKWIDAVSSRTGKWPNIEYTFDTWNRRIRECLSGAEPNDSNRCFSRKLKEEYFRGDPTCRICGQRINSVDDAAMDHELHYWRGGKTIPSNARLAHRLCNSTRSR